MVEQMNALSKEDFESVEVTDEITRLHEEDATENLYHSCCGGSSDKRLVILLTQVSISIIVIIFSAIMLAFSSNNDDKSIYISLISSTISYWLGKNDAERS